MGKHDLGRRRGGDGAERAQHDEPAVGERDALGGEPQHDGLEAGHEGAGDAEADEPSADGEGDEPVRKGKEDGTSCRNGQKDGLDAARTEAVEPGAEGELDQAEGEEVGRRQEPEIPGDSANSATSASEISALMER